MTDPKSPSFGTPDDLEEPKTVRYPAIPSEARATVPEINTAVRDQILKLIKEGYEIVAACPAETSTDDKKAFTEILSKFKTENTPYQITSNNGALTIWTKKKSST